jgi:hypothetical protein
MRKQFNKLTFFALIIPMEFNQGWKMLEYKSIPTHQVISSTEKIHFKVAKSAAPIIFQLKEPTEIHSFILKGGRKGFLNFGGNIQGEKDADDFSMRLGLVEQGNKTLSWLQKAIAPQWIIKLHELAQGRGGIEKIHFFNFSESKLPWESRVHPLSDLIQETIIGVPDSQGNFDITYKLSSPIKTLALWVAFDGDDTKSEYEIWIDKIVLNP